jgi:hypothetical protein
MKLREVAKVPYPPEMEQVRWMKRLRVENYTVRADGTVDVDGDAIITSEQYHGPFTLPVQFGIVQGEFGCYVPTVTSLRGMPERIGNDFACRYIHSFHGVETIIKYIGRSVYIDPTATHILGFLLIEGIRNFAIDGTGGKLNKIMNKYKGTGDIISAQDELIDAGFKEQARL